MTTDVLGEPWTAETLDLGVDSEGPVVATLVHHRAATPSGRAVLHVHGFADYFFQTEYAAWWIEQGYDFYALDLRKYGRSLREHQTPNHVTDLADHHPELDLAWERVRADHDQIIVSAHSTGGLIVSLWADERRPDGLAGLVLNSPWLDLRGPLLLRTVGTALIDQVGRRRPLRPIPRKVSGNYARSLHRDHDGEWDFDLAWKPLESFAVHAGWLRAVRAGHARLHRGLDVPAPVLVLSSDRTGRSAVVDETLFATDVVLDVEQIRHWSTAIGRHVTYVAVPGAMHDVVLSRPAVREQVYDVVGRWTRAFVG